MVRPMPELHRPMFDARVRAVLGPTNTGKTHLAMTRLLAHASGIIGFPLRLLARENYDRMVAAKGERHVALITGEEKIVPPEAKWFACTVEAMPLDRQAEFVAVDEIQLCADPDRGHVFTDRLLHARGMVETMFLGAETIRPLLQRLVPQAEIETRPRLSPAHPFRPHQADAPARRAPPWSPSRAGEVYAIAEAIRRRRGGCAVVMGRLSPRTRNAQVALYQEREVDFLVATDAIGMGLNMDVDHVAFAALSKFDGHTIRAARAPRKRRRSPAAPGAACATAPSARPANARRCRTRWSTRSRSTISSRCTTLAWRNSDLDFSGVDALLDSLAAPPPHARPRQGPRRDRPRHPVHAGAGGGDPRSSRTGAAPASGCCGKPARCRTSASSPTTATPRSAAASSATWSRTARCPTSGWPGRSPPSAASRATSTR